MTAWRADESADLNQVTDLVAALGEHVVDLDRRVSALESKSRRPKPIAASDVRKIARALMKLSLMRRRR